MRVGRAGARLHPFFAQVKCLQLCSTAERVLMKPGKACDIKESFLPSFLFVFVACSSKQVDSQCLASDS